MTMKPENGKFYWTRHGDLIGPISVPPESRSWNPDVYADCGVFNCWYENGKYRKNGMIDGNDLVAEFDLAAKLAELDASQIRKVIDMMEEIEEKKINGTF